MYKLVIVDDESEIREGLCNYFPWKHLGFEIEAEFADGVQALEYLLRYPVDVILCDIKMPFMTGLELAKEIYLRKLTVKTVLLSGYQEFDYAQEALRYDVKEYIVKPTKYDELIKVFSRIKDDLDLDQAKQDSATGEPTEVNNYNDKVIAAIKYYIQQNYQTANLDDAAQLVHMNPFYLSKFFKDKTGKNFSDYLLDIRMKQAAKLLADISYKTYEVSELVGYSNPKNFTRTFKKFFGKTPKEFRNSS